MAAVQAIVRSMLVLTLKPSSVDGSSERPCSDSLSAQGLDVVDVAELGHRMAHGRRAPPDRDLSCASSASLRPSPDRRAIERARRAAFLGCDRPSDDFPLIGRALSVRVDDDVADAPRHPDVKSGAAGNVASRGDGPPDAPHVVVDVAEQTPHDELLGRHGWRVGEHDSALRQLIVVQATDYRRCRRRPLLEERERLRPSAVGVLLACWAFISSSMARVKFPRGGPPVTMLVTMPATASSPPARWCAVTPTIHFSAAVTFFQSASPSFPSV